MSRESKSQETTADRSGTDRAVAHARRPYRLSEFGLQGAPNAPLACLQFEYRRLTERQLP